MIPKNVKISEFSSILYSKALREFKRPKFGIGDRVRISKYDLPFRKGYKPQFRKEVAGIVAISSKRLPTYTIKVNKMRLSAVNFIRKSCSKSINNGIVYNRVGFKCICASISRQYTELFTIFLPEQLKMEGQWEVAISEISYPSRYENVTEGKFMFIENKLSKSSEFHCLETDLYPSITDIVEAKNTLIPERHNHSENCITVSVSKNAKS